MENKKTKLTISGSPKKSFKNFETSKIQGKKTTIIDRKSNKLSNNKKGFDNFSARGTKSSNFKKDFLKKSDYSSKAPQFTSDFERRKLAEQRATKRLKDEADNKSKKTKLEPKKRELKLTVSRALSDQIETRERSLASVKRARQKELKNANKNDDKENLKPIKRDVNIPEAITVRELANRMAEQSRMS